MSQELWSFVEMEQGRTSETGRKMASEAIGKAGLLGLEACGIVFCDKNLLKREEADGLSGLKKIYLFPGDLLHSPEAAALALGGFRSYPGAGIHPLRTYRAAGRYGGSSRSLHGKRMRDQLFRS